MNAIPNPDTAPATRPGRRGTSPARSRLSRAVVLALLTALVWGFNTGTAHANYDTRRGFSIPHEDGTGGSWIGSFTVDARTVYCADPRRTGPATSGGYGKPYQATTWNDVAGNPVPAADLQRASYILSRYGVTDTSATPNVNAAAVDTAIYALLGRGTFALGGERSNERANATGQGSAVLERARAFLDQSAQFYGTPTLTVSPPKTALPGRAAPVKLQVTSGAGQPYPGVALTLTYPEGVTGPARVTTGDGGGATINVKAPRAGKFALTATATNMAPAWPTARNPVKPAAQRMMVAGITRTYTARGTLVVSKHPVEVQTRTSGPLLAPGSTVFDKVTLTTAGGYTNTVTSTLYGPFDQKPGPGDCTSGRVFATTRNKIEGAGTFNTRRLGPLNQPGWYTWITTAPATTRHQAIRTPCGVESETLQVQKLAPTISTTISDPQVRVGGSVFDNITVSGMGELTEPVQGIAQLYGPGESIEAIDCAADPVRNLTFKVTGDGTYKTAAVKLNSTGWYTWVISIPETATTQAVGHGCGVVEESAFAKRWEPTIETVANAQTALAGSALFDNVTVKNYPDGHRATVIAYLWGPASKESQIECSGKPAGKVEFTITKAGTYKTPTVTPPDAGWYGWTEELAADNTIDKVVTACRIAKETTLTTRAPMSRIVIPTGDDPTAAGPLAGPDTQTRRPPLPTLPDAVPTEDGTAESRSTVLTHGALGAGVATLAAFVGFHLLSSRRRKGTS